MTDWTETQQGCTNLENRYIAQGGPFKDDSKHMKWCVFPLKMKDFPVYTDMIDFWYIYIYMSYQQLLGNSHYLHLHWFPQKAIVWLGRFGSLISATICSVGVSNCVKWTENKTQPQAGAWFAVSSIERSKGFDSIPRCAKCMEDLATIWPQKPLFNLIR